jgi:hypothetical protein
LDVFAALQLLTFVLARGLLTGGLFALNLLALAVLPAHGLLALLFLAGGVLTRFHLLALGVVAALHLLAFALTLSLLLADLFLARFGLLAALVRAGFIVVLFLVFAVAAVPILRGRGRTHAKGESRAQRYGPKSLLAEGEFHVGFLFGLPTV